MRILIVIAILLVLILITGPFYVVKETDQVVLTQFGKPVGDPITDPGLKFKIPFIQSVHRFDKRFLEWDGAPNQLPTRDKRFIWVDTYARWRIVDSLLFFQRLRDERGAQTRLDDILDGEVRNAIAKYDLVDVVRSTNREAQLSENAVEDEILLVDIEIGRDDIRREVLRNAQARITDLGIEILDIQFKRINYVEDVRRKAKVKRRASGARRSANCCASARRPTAGRRRSRARPIRRPHSFTPRLTTARPIRASSTDSSRRWSRMRTPSTRRARSYFRPMGSSTST
jgi:HflC protein